MAEQLDVTSRSKHGPKGGHTICDLLYPNPIGLDFVGLLGCAFARDV